MTPDDFKVMHDKLLKEITEMEERIVLGTADEWHALACLKDAARSLFAAYALLTYRLNEEAER